MEASELDEEDFFRAIARSGASVLLIGRRALVALGIPVLAADYDLWVQGDGIALLNAAVAPLRFEDAWARRQAVVYAPGVPIALPSIEDLILTKRWSMRPKDVDDIAMLEKLKGTRGAP